METHVFLAVLAAALLHAGWNSVVKVGLDRFSSVMLLALAQGGIAALLAGFWPLPDPAAWGWILGAGLLHSGYKLFLIKAYEHADLSQAYPLARGSAPLIVSLVSVLFLGAHFSGQEVLAILVISGGILLMALKGGDGGRMGGKALFYALGTAGFTASYTLADGIGARIAGTASGFFLWMVIVDTLAMIAAGLMWRGPKAFPALLGSWKSGLAAGAMSLGAYWIAVWAFTQAPIAMVAALRESSIFFAVAIAAFVVREPVGKWRWASAGAIALGVAVMRL